MGEDGRTFLRGIGSETYGLYEFRKKQRSVPRVRRAGTVTDDASVGHSGDSDAKQSRTWWMLGPGDEPFLTQTLQVHFVELLPGGTNHGHGHQNEAHFYILEGKGYEIHDGKRYEWEKDDLVIVHTDSKHKHFNRSMTERRHLAKRRVRLESGAPSLLRFGVELRIYTNSSTNCGARSSVALTPPTGPVAPM